MKKTKVLILTIIFIFLILLISASLNIVVLAETKIKQANVYRSNGDLIEGWYWLRDPALQNYAEWTFEDIPAGTEEIVLNITALATDRPSGESGFEAKFKLIYGFPGSGNMGGVFKTKTVILPNVSAPDDPLGYTCQGEVTVDRDFIPNASTILFRIERESAQDNHIAFREDSIMLLAEEEEEEDFEEIEELEEVEEEQLPDTNILEEAILIQPGTYTGSLGEEESEGHRNNNDYYRIYLEEGQLITLRLTVPGNANYGISLLNSNRSSRGSSITQRELKTLDYVADSTGTWYIRVSRTSGEGEYQLDVEIEDQDDAQSGQDAGDSYQEAVPISVGTYSGLLKAGDNNDYYSIQLAEGESVFLELTVPGNASYGISLLNPNHRSRGSSITQLDTKTLDYVADSTGIWYIRISRTSGEGEYQLSINSGEDYEEESANHPPVISTLEVSQNPVEMNQNVTITCSASDQDPGEAFTFRWSVNGELIEEDSSPLNWIAPNMAGTYLIACTVSDTRGGEDSKSVSITVNEPGDDSGHDLAEVHYQIEIATGTRIAAGTDANVYITMIGQDGENSGEILLDNPNVNDFEIGDTNTFLVNGIPIENIDHIIIRHDNSGNFPGWYIDTVRIYCLETNQEWFFYPNQWLALDEPPEYQTQGTFYPQEEEMPDEDIECELSLTNGGTILTSNVPIFVAETEKGSEIDTDGDGIHQEWEDKAMEFINPYIELDEEEPWLDNQSSDHVANYVRVHPYDPFSASTDFDSANLPPYIIFRYVVTWSEDYGRQTVGGYNLDFITSHKGDHERIFMAWKIIDSNTAKLDWVFTSSHREPCLHHAVWNVNDRICNLCEVSNVSQTFERTEVMCGNLDFSSDGVLVFYASEGKHALYPSCELCEDATLAHIPLFPDIGEDCCGGGRFRFDCYNVGEPPNLIDPDIHDLTLDNGKLEDDLPELLDQKLKARYAIKIDTGTVDRAGTDARLDVTLYGSQGSYSFSIYTNPEPPRNASYIGTFEKGDTDNIYVPISDLGDINRIRIISDNSGEGPGWYINKIEVKNLQTNTIRSSTPNCWIQESEQLERTFTLS